MLPSFAASRRWVSWDNRGGVVVSQPFFPAPAQCQMPDSKKPLLRVAFLQPESSRLNANEVQVDQLVTYRVTLDSFHFYVNFFTVDNQSQHRLIEFRLLLSQNHFLVVNSDGQGFFACTVNDGRNLVSMTQAAARTFPQVRNGLQLGIRKT